MLRPLIALAGAGVLVACGTTLIGFGSLISSSYGPLRSFGITSVATIGRRISAFRL